MTTDATYAHFTNVFIPKFVYYNKTEFPKYKFIKTLPAGSSLGHILHGNGGYFLCLRQNDIISTDEVWKEPLGFRRKTLAECEKLAEYYQSIVESEDVVYKPKRGQTTLSTNSLHHKQSVKVVGIYFVNGGGHKVEYSNLRNTAGLIGCSAEHLRLSLLKKLTSINGYTVYYPSK